MKRIRTLILGAAGRDFHNFNVFFRDNKLYNIIAFTATQIPYIENRSYPKELAGKLYPKGIPIYPEEKIEILIKKYKIELCVFSYSDVSYDYVMHLCSKCNAAGASFLLISQEQTMLSSNKTAISVCAVRTGCGKSSTTRKIANILKKYGKKAVIIRHPMPYGDLKNQIVQRFESYADLKRYKCTLEEEEEYYLHIEENNIVYAGVDYKKILKKAEQEADVIIWDGGNNDVPFVKPDLHIVLFDPLRVGNELKYYPSEINAKLCNIALITKQNYAKKEQITVVKNNIKKLSPNATIIDAELALTVDNPELIRNKNVICVDDGPTLTHGGLSYGAAYLAAKQLNATVVDPKPYAKGEIKKAFGTYTHLDKVLPSLGYSKKQLKDLEDTINDAKCDAVVIGTPIDLRRLININKPSVLVKYYLKELSKPDLEDIIKQFILKR